MYGIGPTELIIVLVIVLVIFGPKRLPGLGRQLGKGMREFKDTIGGDRDDDSPVQVTQAPARDEHGRREAAAALGRPEGGPEGEHPSAREDAPASGVGAERTAR